MSPWPTEFAARVAGGYRRLRGRAPRHVLYLLADGLWAWPEGSPAGAASSTPTFFEDFSGWCQVHPGAAAKLLLSGDLVHNLVVDPGLGLRGADAVRAYAIQQFAHYYGAAARTWPVAVWTDGGKSVACAAHQLKLAELQASARAQRVTLLGITPVWSAGLSSLAAAMPAAAPTDHRTLVLVEGALVTRMETEGTSLRSLEQRRLDAPRTGPLADLLRGGRSGAPAASALVFGWGLDDSENIRTLPAQVIGSLGAPTTFGSWVLDTMGVPA